MTGGAWIGGPTFRMPQRQPTKDEIIDAFRQRCEAYERDVAAMREQRLFHGAVIHVGGDRADVVANGCSSVVIPPSLKDHIKPGVIVLVDEKIAVNAIVDNPPRMGPVLKVKRVEGAYAIVEENAHELSVAHRFSDLEPGERVTLDATGSVIACRLGPELREVRVVETGVTWEDIGGLSDAKRALVEAALEPAKNPKLYKAYGKKQTKGILLWGPPGCGKSHLARALATAMGEVYGSKTGGFISVRGPELLSKWVGSSEQGIRTLFEQAASFKAEHGYPAIIFLDEADALLGKRHREGMGLEGMERTTVPQFLACMDGLDESAAIVLIATNRPDSLDPAVVRDGRVDRKVHVGRPTVDDAREIATLAFEGKPVNGDLVETLVDRVYKKSPTVYTARTRDGEKDRRITLSAFVSGALIVGIVERATQIALRRDLAGGDVSGISVEDVVQAVEDARKELAGLDHGDVLREALGDVAKDVVRLDPA